MVSTMNDDSNGSEDLFLDDDLNDIFVEGDDSNGSMNNNSTALLEFSHSTVGSIHSEFRRRRSSTGSKATTESKRSRRSSGNDDCLQYISGDIPNSRKQQKTNRLQMNTTLDGGKKQLNSINKLEPLSEIAEVNDDKEKAKGKKTESKLDRQVSKGNADEKVDDDAYIVNVKIESAEEVDTKDDDDILADVELDNNDEGDDNSDDSTCRQLGLNDDSNGDLDQQDIVPTDVLGRSQRGWHSEENDKEHRKQMILEIARLLQVRKKVVPSQEWLHQLPHKARQLEGRLYGAASSLEHYLDRGTLKNRLRIIANKITRQFIDHTTVRSEKHSRFPLSRLAQHPHRQQSAFESRGSIFSNSSTIDTTASLNVALRNKATFVGDEEAKHGRKPSQSGLNQQMGDFQDKQTYNTEEKNHPSGHPSVIIVTRNEDKNSPLLHSMDGADSLTGSHERKLSNSGSLNLRRTSQEGSTGGKDDNISSLTSLQQQLLLQLKQQPHNMGQSPSLQNSQPFGIIGRETAASVGMNSTNSLVNQVKSYDRTHHSLASKTELERQKAVNAQLQEQIMANIRKHEDMVRRLQSKGQTIPQQQLSDLQGRQISFNAINSTASTGMLQQISNNSNLSNSNMQMGNNTNTSSSNVQMSPNMTNQQLQNSAMMQQNKFINPGPMSFSVDTVMSSNASAQSQSGRNGSMLGSGSMGMGNNNNNGNNQISSMYNMNQMSQIGGNNNPLNRSLHGMQGMNNPSFTGVGSAQGNLTNSVQRLNHQLSDMHSSNSNSDFQALFNAQQRALGQQIGNSNNSAMFGNDIVLQQQQQQQQQLQQLQMLRGLTNRQPSGLLFNNNIMNRNSMTPTQAAFQQQQLFDGSGSMSNFNMPLGNLGNGGPIHNGDREINPMMVGSKSDGVGFVGGINNANINGLQQLGNDMMNNIGNERHSISSGSMQNMNMNIGAGTNSNNNLEAGVAPLSPRSFAW